MKIGDKVRFLSEIGGGRVAGFQGKNIVLVEDEDGFQVPMALNEVVVVGEENYDTSRIVQIKQQTQQTHPQKTHPQPLPGGRGADSSADNAIDSPLSQGGTGRFVTERKGGELLSAYLAFVPMDVKELTRTRFEAYFVNDSNYYMRFAYSTAEGAAWHLRFTDEVEPNTKLFIEEFGREDLGTMERVSVQLIAYKRDKPFIMKPAVDVQLRIDGVKFYKLHTFQENDFFEQPALVYTIVEHGLTPSPSPIGEGSSLTPGPSPIGEGSIYTMRQQQGKRLYPPLSNRRGAGGEAGGAGVAGGSVGSSPIVVDLHASELLDTTAGMTASDILNYQLDVFRRTLKNYEKKKGTKIVFIHGKGEGVLRKALVNELQYRYKSYIYQDASFQEYGYGATQVTIK